MANSDKNIVITPYIGNTSADPQIVFSGANANVGAQNITLSMLPASNGTMSFSGSAGQLFSITNNLTGTIFSVNDVSGIPSIEVLSSGIVKQAQYNGNVQIGNTTADGVSKLQVAGSANVTGNITGGNLIQGTSRVIKWTTQASTAPTPAVPGDQWYDSATDKRYLYINDGTSSQWVDQSYPSTFGTLAVTGAATIGGTLGVTGNITGGNLSVTTGTITVGSIINGGSNVSGNIGNSTVYFNTAFIKATSAQYADLAERYVSDADYDPGTVLIFGGDYEVTVSDVSHDSRSAGVVSTEPSYLMNSTQTGQHVISLALTGKVPCWVQGPVAKGDRLVNIRSGVAGRLDPEKFDAGCIIGKSLETVTDASTVLIQIAVGRY